MPLSRIAALSISLAVAACASLRVEPPAARGDPKVELQAPTTPDAGSPDAGTLTFTDRAGREIPWPQAVQPVAILDGPAILAAHAALQHVLERFPKEQAQHCAYSAKAMEVKVGEKDGLYFVNVNHRMDRCGWSEPVSMYVDWFELYAVSPDGRILARYPYSP